MINLLSERNIVKKLMVKTVAKVLVLFLFPQFIILSHSNEQKSDEILRSKKREEKLELLSDYFKKIPNLKLWQKKLFDEQVLKFPEFFIDGLLPVSKLALPSEYSIHEQNLKSYLGFSAADLAEKTENQATPPSWGKWGVLGFASPACTVCLKVKEDVKQLIKRDLDSRGFIVQIIELNNSTGLNPTEDELKQWMKDYQLKALSVYILEELNDSMVVQGKNYKGTLKTSFLLSESTHPLVETSFDFKHEHSFVSELSLKKGMEQFSSLFFNQWIEISEKIPSLQISYLTQRKKDLLESHSPLKFKPRNEWLLEISNVKNLMELRKLKTQLEGKGLMLLERGFSQNKVTYAVNSSEGVSFSQLKQASIGLELEGGRKLTPLNPSTLVDAPVSSQTLRLELR